MVNFRSKSNSPCRSKKTQNESPIRITLNIKTKLRIAEKHKQESKTILHLAEELKIPYSTVQRAITKKNELMIVSSDRCRVYGGGRKQIYPAICEFELYQFILAKNEKGNKVDYKVIREQAIKILEDYCNVNNIEENKKPKLKFSDCWINDFMNRRRLSVRQKTHIAQSNKVTTMDNFKICFEYLVRLNRQAKNILLAKIRNIDETLWIERW
jgi:predicted transcriptional regulator